MKLSKQAAVEIGAMLAQQLDLLEPLSAPRGAR